MRSVSAVIKRWLPVEKKWEESTKSGWFHGWFQDYEEFEAGPGNYVTALVELADGSMVKVEPQYVQFTNGMLRELDTEVEDAIKVIAVNSLRWRNGLIDERSILAYDSERETIQIGQKQLMDLIILLNPAQKPRDIELVPYVFDGQVLQGESL